MKGESPPAPRPTPRVFLVKTLFLSIPGKRASQVTFRYTKGPDSLKIFFEDNGIGIPEEIKTTIFTPDFQKKKGVRLFLTREILDITGITIAETGEPGRGARFEMTVPKGMWRIKCKKE